MPAIAHADEPTTVPLLVVVVEFDGGDEGAKEAVPYDSAYDWSEAVFGGDDSLSSYFLDMSNGTFTFTPASETCSFGINGNHNEADAENDGVVHVTLHRGHGAWGTVNEDSTVAQEFGKVAREALDAAAISIDFTQFDENADGILTPEELAVCLCIAGYDASAFVDYDRTDIPVIWPHSGKFALQQQEDGSETTGDDEEWMPLDDVVDDVTNSPNETSRVSVQFDSYIALAEYLCFDEGKPETVSQEPLGILYHELGHHLGLPDLYALNAHATDESWGDYRVGELSLMDGGAWAEAADGQSSDEFRYQPTALDAWSRSALGWTKPQIASTSGDYTVTSQLSKHGYSALLVPTSDPDEYYLLENRQAEGHDAALANEYATGNPRGGIVIWHIDKSAYRIFGADNQVNDTDHTPAVMEQFFERESDGYTTNWQRGTPVLDQPFYDREACQDNLADGSIAIELPLYGNMDAAPSDRTESGITVRFPTESAREMTVHVEFATDIAGASSQAYPLDSAALRSLHEGIGQLAHIACNALAHETEPDVAIVDAGSVHGGLPAGNITYHDAYGVLPDDANIVGYELTGTQLADLAEQSLDIAARHRCVSQAIDALGRFGVPAIADRLPDPETLAPNADAVLAFAGLSFDVNWNGQTGARASNVTVRGMPLDPQKRYYVTMTPSVTERYELFDNLTPDTLMLWGTPADALRSFIQTPDWEQS